MILIGEDAPTIEKELKGAAPFEHAMDMRGAVERAFASAKSGDVVLLAPACASFDMFDDFEHRGKVFKDEVNNLRGAESEGFGNRVRTPTRRGSDRITKSG
jgi:UDP-N-acetylmuramoylalanine--D-glutamate ligase